MKSALIVDDHPMIHVGCSQMLAEGKDLSSIAKALGVSYKTVANLSSTLKKKTRKRSLAALTQYAMQEDWGDI
ncbi:MAG: LuxR C-terminal-related transcriptional regulator [Pseudomonadota bacterium]